MEPVNWAWVNRFRTRFPDGDAIYVNDGNRSVFVKDYRDWTAADLREVPLRTMQELLVFAAGEHYNTLAEVTPRAFGTPQNFAAAIINEWTVNRGYRIPCEILPEYRGGTCVSNGVSQVRPQSFTPEAAPSAAKLLNISELTRDASPDSNAEMVSPDPAARAIEIIRNMKTAMRAA